MLRCISSYSEILNRVYCINSVSCLERQTAWAFFVSVLHLLVVSPAAICNLTSFIHSHTHFAAFRVQNYRVESCVFLSAPSFFWTFISLCLGDCPLQAGWWQHSTMIERPETAVPSIAVSPFLFEIDQCASIDTTVVFNGLLIEILIGMPCLTVPVCFSPCWYWTFPIWRELHTELLYQSAGFRIFFMSTKRYTWIKHHTHHLTNWYSQLTTSG